MPFFPPGRSLGALLILGSLPGCCTMARLFCGPDRTPWVSVAFETPSAALATFREAARRDDALIAYRCLGEDYKARTGIRGSVEAKLVWERLKEEIKGLHLLGYSEIVSTEHRPDGRIAYVLDVSGYRLRVVLVRQAYWELRWAAPGDDDRIREDGRYVTDLAPLVTLRHDEVEGTSTAALAMPPVVVPDLPADRIVGASVGHLWKVDDLHPIHDEVSDIP